MPELIAAGIYAYADTDGLTQYVRGDLLEYRGSWMSAGTYVPNDVVEYSATNHICIRGNTAQNPEESYYWSHLSRLEPDNLTPQEQLDLEVASIGSLANQALEVAYAGTNLAYEALTAAWAGTAASIARTGTTQIVADWMGSLHGSDTGSYARFQRDVDFRQWNFGVWTGSGWVNNGDTIATLASVADLSDAGTIQTDASVARLLRVLLTGDSVLANPSNAFDGAVLTWEFVQDGVGNHTLLFGSAFGFGTDLASVTLSTSGGAHDFVTAIYNAETDTWYVTDLKRGY